MVLEIGNKGESNRTWGRGRGKPRRSESRMDIYTLPNVK